MSDKILLFIPMYNCEKQIIRVLNRLGGKITEYIHEVIIVNNRSTDNGENAVMEFIQAYHGPLRFHLLRNHQNYGLGGSHKVAFQYALEHDFDYIIVLHGDDQGDIADLLPYLKDRSYRNTDCCLGARFMKGSRLIGYSRFRTFGNAVFNIIFSAAVGKRIYDLGAGLNLYSAKMLKSKYYEQFADDLTFNCWMLFALSAYHQTCRFFPISWREEDQVSNVKMFRQASVTLKIALGYFFQRKQFLAKDLRTKKFVDYAADIVCGNGKDL